MVGKQKTTTKKKFYIASEANVTEEWSSHLCGRTLELQQDHGTGTLHDVEVEQQPLVSVKQTYNMVRGRKRLQKKCMRLYPDEGKMAEMNSAGVELCDVFFYCTGA